MKTENKREKTYFQLSKIGNKYIWTGTYKVHPDHHIDSDENYFYTTDIVVRDEMNMKSIKNH